ncbi:MAG: carbon storage regulator [Clostridia bacterium BRH_c25]|nr:MAG: carbon storage regulator [Clostridia bacterium BRH_c25]
MLVLTRKSNESILIGDDIEIVIVEVSEDKVKIGINAPRSTKIFRKELLKQVEDENIKSTAPGNINISELKDIIKK